MLEFTPLPAIAVFIVNLDGASRQSPKDYQECEATVQSTLVSKSQVTPRRLNIFESIAKSEDQADDGFPASIWCKKGKHTSRDHKSVNGILKRSLIELTETLRTLESDDPFKAMRVPVPVIPVQSPESLLVFQSLLKMLSTPTECHAPPQWQQYLIESISNQQCSVKDLCEKFHKYFKCDQDGHLIVIITDHIMGRFDHLNLLMIPNTVTALYVRRVKLKTISEWTDLKGKSLKVLRVDGNYHLELDLDGLTEDLNHLPLKHLTVPTGAIINSFGGINWVRTSGNRIMGDIQPVEDWERTFSKIGNWMRTSTLTSLALRAKGHTDSGRNVCFNSNGSWKFE